MKITSLLSNLILEASRFQVLYDKLVNPKPKAGTAPGEKKKGVIDFETLKNIIFSDPDTKAPEGFDKENATPEQMEKDVKAGKYTEWLVKNFINPKDSDFEFEGDRDTKNPEYVRARKEYARLFLEDLFKQTERLQFYERVKQYLPQEQRDINKLSIKDLFNIFSNFQLPEKKRKDAEKKLAKKSREGFSHAGGEIIYEGSKWTLIKIEDKGTIGKDAAIYYGGYKDHRNGESDWCTSSPGLNWFDNYIKDGPLYVVFPNEDNGQVGGRTGLPKERYQFHFPSSQFMDRDDHQIELVDYLKPGGKMEELRDFFKSEFAKGLSTQGGTKLEIIYPQGSASKYVAIYGYEELFNNLPETLTSLLVKNNSNTSFEHPIPESIGRLKNLETLMMQNCVSSVPESITKCTNLNFISFPNNPNLKTIPEGLKDLPNLSFINVKGCDPKLVSGENIAPALREMLMDAGKTNPTDKGFYYVMS